MTGDHNFWAAVAIQPLDLGFPVISWGIACRSPPWRVTPRPGARAPRFPYEGRSPWRTRAGARRVRAPRPVPYGEAAGRPAPEGRLPPARGRGAVACGAAERGRCGVDVGRSGTM
ncbi:hypothetical protein GCM10018785_00610 [Streptomyces longispororuber]|uniref:Uncharacterized protein n=1 Tax=Streptomyces longispororuber TaxID=68230 RepID=A0A918Z3M2_9ACTN|nr:hypothetical protein GCM10018785_00610 [Streptomyces longispororuber]